MAESKSTGMAARRRGANQGPQTVRGRLRCEKLLKTATRLFFERGFDNTSINEIVRLSGGSLSTAYQWFGSKEDLFAAVFEHSLEEVRIELEKMTFQEEDGEAAVNFLRRVIEVIYHAGFEKKIVCFISFGVRSPEFRKKVFGVLEREIIAPLRCHFQTLEKAGVHFRLGIEETLMIVMRHIRGTSFEFIMGEGTLENRKADAVLQTMAVLNILIEEKSARGFLISPTRENEP